MSGGNVLDDARARLDRAEEELESLATDGAPAELLDRLLAAVAELREAEMDLAAARDDVLFALEGERRRYRDLFDLAPDAYLVTDPHGKILEANRAAADLLGVAGRRLEGKPITVYFELEQRRRLRHLLLRSAEPSTVTQHDLRLRTRQGDVLDLALSIAPMSGTQGDVVGLRWLIRDVTSRRVAERRLHELAQELERRVDVRTGELEQERGWLAAILRELPAGVIVAEAPSGRLVLHNDRVVQLLGLERLGAETVAEYERFAGYRTDGQRYSPAEWPIARSLATGEVVTGELIAIDRPDCSRAAVEMNSTPVRDREGRIVAAAATLTDVTARERRERAEREFVTNAAHELQTPLAAIISASEVLDAGAKEVPADRDRFLAHIRRECNRLSRLVQALLTLARAQTGGEEPPLERLELQPLLDEVALSLQPAPGVQVRVDCPGGLVLRANRDLLAQAVAGLGSNAAKYAPAGTIWLRGRETDDGQVSIDVLDEGPGIPSGEEERLFDRFYRAGGRDRNGFGLGLPIVRQAVEALGGDVELHRRTEGGTAARILVRADGAPRGEA